VNIVDAEVRRLAGEMVERGEGDLAAVQNGVGELYTRLMTIGRRKH
jgi:hypothetical protein